MREAHLYFVQRVPVSVWRAERSEKKIGHKLHLKPEFTFALSPLFAHSRDPFFLATPT